MARGRKPMPAEIKEARGNPGRRPIVATPDEAPALDGGAPKSLKGDALKIWKAVAPGLRAMKFLRATDAFVIERYCLTAGDWLAARRKVARGRAVYETDTRHGKMQRIHPWFMVQDRLEKRLIEYEDRLGLSPRARQVLMQQMAAATPQLLPLDGGTAQNRDDAPAPESPIGMLTRTSIH